MFSKAALAVTGLIAAVLLLLVQSGSASADASCTFSNGGKGNPARTTCVETVVTITESEPVTVETVGGSTVTIESATTMATAPLGDGIEIRVKENNGSKESCTQSRTVTSTVIQTTTTTATTTTIYFVTTHDKTTTVTVTTSVWSGNATGPGGTADHKLFNNSSTSSSSVEIILDAEGSYEQVEQSQSTTLSEPVLEYGQWGPCVH